MPARVAASGSRSVASATAAAATHLAVGTGVHTLADGCPPTSQSLMWIVPVGLVAVVATDRLLSGSGRSVRLAGGQLAVHTVLALVAVCVGGAAADPQATAAHEQGASAVAGAALLMLSAHAFAVLLCLALLHRIERAAADAAQRAVEVVEALVTGVTAGLTRPALAVPRLGRVRSSRPVAVPRAAVVLVDSPRGPPAFAG